MKFISEMNRIDWVGNPGPVIRRGEVIEMDECDRTATWLKMGYVSVEAAVTPDTKPDENPKPASKPKQNQNGKKEKPGTTGV